MSRDGDSGEMASRRRVWYPEQRRHLQSEAEQTDAQSTPVGVLPGISTQGGDLTAHLGICYNTRRHEKPDLSSMRHGFVPVQGRHYVPFVGMC